MDIFSGKSIYKGIVIGKIKYISKSCPQIKRESIADSATEEKRFKAAVEKAKEQLKDLCDRASAETGKTGTMIFEAHMMLLEDAAFIDSVTNIISTEGVNAEYAVAVTRDNLSKMFSEMSDEYLSARGADIVDISERVISILQDRKEDISTDAEGIGLGCSEIVVADELTPSEALMLDKCRVFSLVTKHGSINSHTAILARTMRLPSLTGVETEAGWNGRMAVVDAIAGQLIIDPDVETLKKYQAAAENEKNNEALLNDIKGKPNVTRDGKQIRLFANIGGIADVKAALENEAEGIGLLRSEFICMGRPDYPSEEEQLAVYKAIVQGMAGKRVVIRTFDIGADKQADCFESEHEENPALGYRAIRISLDRTDLFRTQLRAIYRASVYGKVAVMFPMIISLEEVIEIKKICEEVKDELRKAAIAFGDVELGIMIETPAAVMISDILAKEVDFFSIGTNDLTQYTLAVDRQNTRLDRYYNPHHEALLRMIKMVIDNGHAGGCRVGICGELGADTSLTERFIQMGIDELSVATSFLLPVRKAVRESIAVYKD